MGDDNNMTNILHLRDVRYNALAPYTAASIEIYKCPADPKKQASGKKLPSVRSYALNQAVGTICPGFSSGSGHSGVPTLSTHGPWLDGNHGHTRNKTWWTFGKDSDFKDAASTFTFIDEDHRSINDGGFGTPGKVIAANVPTVRWVDMPGSYHNKACGLSFADGHSEIRRWKGPKFKSIKGPLPDNSVPAGLDRVDWEWMCERGSQPVK
jgi:prepilin-type processing-associated H-X9-DG protein